MKVRKSLGDLGGADGGKQSVSLHPNHLKSLLKKHFNLYGMPPFLWFQLPTIYLRFTASIIEFSIVIVSYVFQKECINFQYVSGNNIQTFGVIA